VYPRSYGSAGSGGTTIDPHVPLAHSSLVEQIWRLFNLQAGAPSAETVQMLAPVQGPSAVVSSAPLTGMHIPGLGAWLQLKQVPLQASLQQTPSTQKPLAHWAASVQVGVGG
jgi:hypothetical protein